MGIVYPGNKAYGKRTFYEPGSYLSFRGRTMKNKEAIMGSTAILWLEEIRGIVYKFKKMRKIEDPLDGDMVDELCEIVKAQINFNEGNITSKEYQDKLAGFGI